MAQADAGRSGIERSYFQRSPVDGDGVEEALVTLLRRCTCVLLSALHHLTATRTKVACMCRLGQFFSRRDACIEQQVAATATWAYLGHAGIRNNARGESVTARRAT